MPVFRVRCLRIKGFTLIEILLAIFIFAVAVSTIYASYSGTFRVIGMTESRAEVYRKARIALQRIIEDLESAYYSGQGTAPEDFLGIDEKIKGRDADTLRFISTAHLVFSEKENDSGKAVIEYKVLENETEGGLSLYRYDMVDFNEEPEEDVGGFVLCDDLSAVRFTYFDSSGQAYDEWDAANEDFAGKSPRERIPKMVSVNLEFKNDSRPEDVSIFKTSVVLPISQQP